MYNVPIGHTAYQLVESSFKNHSMKSPTFAKSYRLPLLKINDKQSNRVLLKLIFYTVEQVILRLHVQCSVSRTVSDLIRNV